MVKSRGRFSRQSKKSAGLTEAYNWQQELRNLLNTLQITCKTSIRICKPGMVTLLSKTNWPLKAYDQQHQELPLGKNDVRCHLHQVNVSLYLGRCLDTVP